MDVGILKGVSSFERKVIMQARYLIGGAVGVVGLLIAVFVGAGVLSARSAGPNASNTVVSCEPNQRVVVRHFVSNGELQVATECVGAATNAGLMPAVYQTSGAPVVYAAPQTSRARAASTARTSSARRASAQEPEKKRTWQQTALVIGGAAGAGAGVGALVDGKKGALIGAAIGGGAGAIYEAIKRK
jgi:hypothetical protein